MDSIIGKRFGKLTVVSKTNERCSYGSFLYECKCDCGNIVKNTSSRLKSGHVKSCGCEHYLSKDLTDRTFNHLNVTDYSHSSGYKTFWNCLCDCGKTTVVRGDYLKNVNTVSCGCITEQTLNAGRTELKKAFVDGTTVTQINSDRKLNSNNKTGVKGVCWPSQKQKYRAQITFKGKVYHLGFYDKLEDVAQVRKQSFEAGHQGTRQLKHQDGEGDYKIQEAAYGSGICDKESKGQASKGSNRARVIQDKKI